MSMIRKLTCLLLSFALLAGVVACAPASQTPATQTPMPMPTENSNPAKAQSYAPGAYEAEAVGINGKVRVAVTFTQDAISSVEVIQHIETVGVSEKATTWLPEEIVAQQSLAVDTVAGATVTSYAVLSAVQSCVEQAGGDISALKQSVAEKKAPEAMEASADVVIVGGGGAGLAAAVTALELGASVIIVEKVDYLGGNTLVSGGIYNSADPEAQASIEMTDALREMVKNAVAEEPVNENHAKLMADVKADYEAYLRSGATGLFDSTAWHALQTWNGGDKVGDIPLIRTFADRAPEGLAWLKGLGMVFKEEIAQGGGALYQRTHYTNAPLGTAYIDSYKNALKQHEDKVRIYYRTTADELIVENGRVSGIYATDRAGNTYTFKAQNGVILATGGFASNVALRKEYCEGEKWPDLGKNVKSTNLPGITGDGILMAEAVGANLVDMEQIQLLHTCSPRTGTTWANYYTSASLIFVNKEGERFIREDGRRDDMSKAIIAQTDSMMYLVQSGDYIPDPAQAKTADGVPLLDVIEMGDWFMADTVEELAEKISVPAEALQATIDAYNEAVDTSNDEFGRTLLSMKMETGPWYAYPRTPSAHHTMGGVQIDDGCHVINKQGVRIEGLYAAGEITGDIHGGNRLGGNAIADTVVFGRIAGENAAKKG